MTRLYSKPITYMGLPCDFVVYRFASSYLIKIEDQFGFNLDEVWLHGSSEVSPLEQLIRYTKEIV